MPKRAGRKSKAQTPAPRKERIYGSKKNPKGSAASEKSASKIKLDDKTMTALKNKLKEFKEKHPNKKNITLNDLKAVYRRGAGAYSKSHRPTITGGAPNTRNAWSMARVNKFLLKAGGTKVKAAYVQDDDLMKMEDGGSTLLAPNGKPSNLNSEQWHLVRTPQFKAWFGDWENDPQNASKVVDENGEPLVVYHGSDNVFNVFKSDKQIYFATNKEYAILITESLKESNTRAFFLNIRNLLDATKFGLDDYSHKEYKTFLADNGVDVRINKTDDKSITRFWYLIATTNIPDAIKEKYNGFSMYENMYAFQGKLDEEEGDDPSTKVYVCFEANQIKLADGRNKTFDPNKKDIRYSKGGEVYASKIQELISSLENSKYHFVDVPRNSLFIGFDRDLSDVVVRNVFDAVGNYSKYFNTSNIIYYYDESNGDMVFEIKINDDISNIELPNEIPQKEINIENLTRLNFKSYEEEQEYLYPSIVSNIFPKKRKGYTYTDEHGIQIGRAYNVSFEKGGQSFNDKELLAKWKRGESIGFTATAHLKAKGLIPRSDGTKRKSPQYKKEGGLIGGFEDLTDEWLSKKIEIFLNKVKPIKFYFVDPNTNTLTVGFDKYYSHDAAQKVYEEATSSKEFFHAPSVESTYDSKTGDLIFKIKLKKVVEYNDGGEVYEDDEYYEKTDWQREQEMLENSLVDLILHDEQYALNLNDRYILSHEKNIEFRNKEQDNERDYKPKGLWYAFNYEWASWVYREMPRYARDYDYVHKIEVTDKVLSLDTIDKCIEFTKRYGIEQEWGNHPIYKIDWIKVAKDYSGIEVTQPYQWSRIHEHEYTLWWLYGWDVGSGCVWNEDGIKSIELVHSYYAKGGKIDNGSENFGQPANDYSGISFIHETKKENANSILKNGFRLGSNPRITKGIYTIPLQWKREKFDWGVESIELEIELKEGSKIFWTNTERPSDFYYGQGNKYFNNLYKKLHKGNPSLLKDGSDENRIAYNKRMEKWLDENGYVGVQQGGEIVITDPKAIEKVTKFKRKEDGGEVESFAKGGEVDEKVIKERWAKKKDSLMNMADNIRSLRTNLRKDLKGDNDKDRLTALAISIMDKTAERVGNDESEANGHLGITGLSKSNIKVEGNTITLKYIGKSGVKHEKQFSDEGIATALKDAIANSQSKYVFETSDGFRIKNDRINRYLNEYDISAKDLRGYSANQWIVSKLREVKDKEILGDEAKRKKKFNEIVKSVAEKVGHGAPTLKKHYMLPSLEREWVNNGKIVDLANIKRAFEDGGEIDEYKQGGVTTIPNIESSLQTFYINHKLNYPYNDMALVNKMLKSLGKDIKVVKYLGGGTNGGAYLTSDKKVLKIGDNEQEAYSSFVIFKNPKDFTTQAKVHDLFVINNLTKKEIKEEKSSRGFVVLNFRAKHDKTYFILKDFVDVLSLDELEEDVAEIGIKGYARKYKFNEVLSKAIETIEDAYVEDVKMSKEQIEKLEAYLKPYYDFGKKLEIEGKKYGLQFGDSGGLNMGYDSNDNLICFDCLSESKYMLKKGGDVGVADINQGASVVNNIDYDPLDENQDIPNDGEGIFKKGGELEFNDIVLYHEKNGNWFVPKNTVYAWLYQDPNAAKKLEGGEFDFVLFPPNPPMSLAMQRGYVPPLLKIWTKKYQKETKGADNLLGIVKAWYDEKNKKLYIIMMTTRKDMRRKGVNSHIIKNLREEFKLDKDQIVFDKPTKEGEMFSKSGKYNHGGEVDLFEHYDELPKKIQAILDKYENEEPDYTTLESLQGELEEQGYTFDYGLDYEPYNLRKMEKGGDVVTYSNKTNEYFDRENKKWVREPFTIKKGQLIEYNHSDGGRAEARFLAKAGEKRAKIEILHTYSPWTKRVESTQYVNPAGRTEPAYFLKDIPRGTIKTVSVDLIEPVTDKTFQFRAKPISKWLRSPEFKEAFGHLDNPTTMAKGGDINDEEKKETYKKWKSLVNMSKSELEKFYNSEEGKVAGLTASQAKSQGIDSGRESARWIMKMKDTSVKNWTPTMWKWAKKQISFISRMSGNKGKLYDESGAKTRKHTSLLIWGHNPTKKAGGGELDIPIKENAMNEVTYNQLPAINDLKVGKKFVLKEHYYNNHNGKPTHQGCRYLIVENMGDAQMSDCLKLKVHQCYGGGGVTTMGIITRPIKNIMNKGRDMGESLASGVEKAFKKGGELDPDKKEVKEYFEHKSGAAGGLLVGKRHSEGGIQAINKSTGQPLEMEGGEVVITRDAVSDSTLHDFNGKQMTNREILSAINESGGGVKFAEGGDVSCKCSGKEYKLGGKTYKDYELFKKINNSYGSKSAIEKGMKVEDKEHGETFRMLKNGEITYEQFLKKLVVDHLSENPKYYDK